MIRLCTICARSGSKGVRNKNIRELAGRPLIAHSIMQAKDSGLFEAVVVSSDGDDILEAADKWGADHLVKRPAELATDQSPKIPVIRHALLTMEERLNRHFEVIVDLDATAPLRRTEDIANVVALLESQGADNVITGVPSRRSPYFNMVEIDDDGLVQLSKPLPEPIYRRQDAPKSYDMNASIYAWRREVLIEGSSLFNAGTLLYVMPQQLAVDIDTELDFQLVAQLMRMRGKEID